MHKLKRHCFSLFLGLILFFSASLSQAQLACVEVFVSKEAIRELYLSRIPSSYLATFKEMPELEFFFLLLMNKGLRFDFYNAKTDVDVSYDRFYTDPSVVAPWKDGQFDFSQTRIRLPRQISDLAPRSGGYELMSHLARINMIYELQKQGALFDQKSMTYQNRVSIIGFKKNADITDFTLVAIQHLIMTFGFERVSFEPLEAELFRLGFAPQDRFVRNPFYPLELVIRSYYLERPGSWEDLTLELEGQVFSPAGQPLLPTQETRIQ